MLTETNPEIAKRLTDAMQINTLADNLFRLAPYNNRATYANDLLKEAANRLTMNDYQHSLELRLFALRRKCNVVTWLLWGSALIVLVETVCLVIRH